MEDFEGKGDDLKIGRGEFDIEFLKLKKMGFKEELESLEKNEKFADHKNHQSALKEGKSKGRVLGKFEALIE